MDKKMGCMAIDLHLYRVEVFKIPGVIEVPVGAGTGKLGYCWRGSGEPLCFFGCASASFLSAFSIDPFQTVSNSQCISITG